MLKVFEHTFPYVLTLLLLLFFSSTFLFGHPSFSFSSSSSSSSMQQQKTRLIVCFGDSLTAGMVGRSSFFEPYAKHIHFQNTKVVEFGFPGMTSREMTKRVDEVLVLAIVLLMFGFF